MHCRKLFQPDPRNVTRQKSCSQPECRKASKAASQKKWLEKPENKDYFQGTDNTRRVQQWRKLDGSIRELFKKRLAERIAAPHVPSARLSGLPDCYKIKLRDISYRLVYQVIDDRLLVVVITVGRRDHDQVYHSARKQV